MRCRRCPREIADVAPGSPGRVLCDECVQTLRDDAAIRGAEIAAHSETLTDHRSPGERLRED